MKIIKRNGEISTFYSDKIVNAITMAMDETEVGIDFPLALKIANEIEDEVEAMDEVTTVEEVQDAVERALSQYGRFDVAKRYIIYREERAKARNRGWELTDLPKDIYEGKYRYGTETEDEFFFRVSGGNSEVEKIIRAKDFLFAGRILAGRGINRNVTLSNCYVLPQPEDNLESIFDTAKYMARTYSYGGGVGFDISKLRPKGSKVNNSALTTSGAVSFMELYSTTTGLIGQKGRRGALMISMDVDHADIIDFVNVKRDLDKVTFANISVRFNNNFFNSMDDFKNKDILKEIATSNWQSGEPGALFWDRVEGWHLLEFHPYYKLYSTNPCFTGDMKLLTIDGFQTFENLSGKNVSVINIDGDVTNGKVWYTGEKETIKLRLSNLEEIICTPNHVFLTTKHLEVEAKDLKGKKIMPYLGNHKTHLSEFIKYGFIQGDGCLTRLNSNSHLGVEVNIGENDDDIRYLFRNDDFTEKNHRYIYLQGGYKDKLIELGFDGNVLPERVFPTSYDDWSNLEKSSFLQGCYSANGSVITKYRVAYKTTSIEFAKKLVETLSDDFGIIAYITTNKEKSVEFENGKYLCKESYDINIGRYKDLQTFHREINFYHKYKQLALDELLLYKVPSVMNILDNGIQKVYDFNEPVTNWGVVEGYIAHNCGEQPLPEWGSCLLGSINLSNFVVYPYTNSAYIDYERLKKVTRTSVIALNEVLDDGMELHPLKEQQEVARQFRQIGLGIMGLSDMLIKMGIEYGSADSLHVSECLGKLIQRESITQSVLLADKYGTYPQFDLETLVQSHYFKSLDEDIQDLIIGTGMRNSHVLSIAPTGSISTMLGISGGIEPIFATNYTRTTKSLIGDKDADYKVYTPVVGELIEELNITDSQLPSFVVTSHEIDPLKRVKLQGVWQKYVDSAISSTINLNEDATVSDIEEIYFEAWKHGLKGVTIFRNNCLRKGILTTPKEEEPEGESEGECGT